MKKIISVLSIRKIVSIVVALAMMLSTLQVVDLIAKASANAVELVNPDFEDGLNGYDYANTVTATVVADTDRNSNVLKLESNAAKPYGSQLFWQEVEVEAGKTYVWKFYAKATNNNNSFVGVRSADGTKLLASSITCSNNNCVASSNLSYATERDASQVGANWHVGMRTGPNNANITSWQDYTITFYSGEHTTVLLSFNLWAGDRVFYVDNMALAKLEDEVGNELTNGGFEDGLSGYEFATVSGFTVETVTDTVKSGSKALHLKVTGGTIGSQVFWQKVSVEANSTYEWKFWAKSNSGASQNTLVGVRTADGTELVPSNITCSNISDALDPNLLSFDSVRSISPWSNWHQGVKSKSGSKEWVEYTVTFETTEETAVLLTLNPFATGREIWVDDMSFGKPQSISAEEFKNGDFEDGLNGYEYAAVSGFTVETVTDTVKSGSKALHLKVTGGTIGSQVFWQKVSVESNSTYEWKFWAKSNSGASQNTMVGVRTADGTGLVPSNITCSNISDALDPNLLSFDSVRSISPWTNWHQGVKSKSGSKEWVEYTVTFETTEETAVLLTLNPFATGREIWIDDMSLTSIKVIGEIVNGDFEYGLSGYSYDKAITSIATGSGNVYSGEKAVKLAAISSGQSIFKTVYTEKDKKYVWKFWAKLTQNKEYQVSVTETQQNPSAVETEVKTTVGNSKIRNDGGKSYIVGTGDWNEYTVTFLSGENESLRLILSSTDADTIFTDNWSLTVYAEPGILINPSFEEGINGYTIFETDGFTAEAVSDTVKDGTKALHLKMTGSDVGNAMIWQSVAVETNTEYKWKFWAKSNSGATKNTLVGVRTVDGSKLVKSNITCNNVDDSLDPSMLSFDSVRSASTWSNWHQGIRSKSGSKGWVEYTVTFETGDITNVLLTVNAFAKDREIWLDNMSLEALRKTEIIPNAGFEKGTEGYFTEGLIISADSENKYYGDYSLKMSGAGILKKPVEIDAYTDYEWTFYFKTATAGEGYFAVCSEDSNTLLASDIAVSYGTGAVENVSFTDDRIAGQKNNYHKVTSDGTWSKYTVKFNSGKQNNVVLTYLGDGTESYTDEWSLSGSFVYPEEQLLNAGFEDGKFNAYNHDSNVTAEITTENPRSGKYAAVLTKDATKGGNAHLYQTVKVKPNSDYIWTFWVKFENSATPVGADAVNSNNAYLLSRIGGDHNSTSESGFDWHRIRYSDGEWHKYQISLSTGNADMIKLRLYMYTASSKIVTDDWSLDYVGETKSSNTIFNVGFENENAIHTTDSSSWAVTDAEAHSGSKSAIYDGSKAMAGSQLLYNDEYGIERKIATLEKNTNYRFSFYYKGTGKLERAFLRLEFQNRSYENILKNTIGCDDEEWNYFEIVFNNEDSAGALFKISSVFVGYKGTLLYVDDIKLEKIVPGITDHTSDLDSIECSEEENLIPDNLAKEIILDNTADDIYELKLTPYGLYNFAFDYYGENDPNAQIGLSFAEDGTVFTADKIYATSVSSIVNINENSSEFLRSGYSFCAPESGVVYLIMKNNSGTVKIKNLTLYSILPKSVDFKEIPTSSNGSTNSHASIWDQEYDFDFDWNNGDNNFEDIIIESEDNIEENKPSGKRMLRVKKRVLISKGKPGINVWLIVAICAAAVIVAFGTVFAILFIRKKKKKNKI